MSANGGRFRWVIPGQVEQGTGPRLVRVADVPYGRYEVMQHFSNHGSLAGFDCWFTRHRDGVLIYLGKASSFGGATDLCERGDVEKP